MGLLKYTQKEAFFLSPSPLLSIHHDLNGVWRRRRKLKLVHSTKKVFLDRRDDIREGVEGAQRHRSECHGATIEGSLNVNASHYMLPPLFCVPGLLLLFFSSSISSADLGAAFFSFSNRILFVNLFLFFFSYARI